MSKKNEAISKSEQEIKNRNQELKLYTNSMDASINQLQEVVGKADNKTVTLVRKFFAND